MYTASSGYILNYLPANLTRHPKIPFKKIYKWFHQNQRDLPWRKKRNPYRVWISEIMLQQTRSEVVKGYFKRWMKIFPNLKSLATYSNYSNNKKQSREEMVLSLWQGLGYYSRALNIIKTADIVYREYKGKFPQDLKLLLTLPGIGPYTAGAILNFGLNGSPPTAMVDGNFERVFARFFFLSTNKKNSSTKDKAKLKKQVWNIAENLVHDPHNLHPDIFNEAIMELGATVCRRKNPNCTDCPLGNWSTLSKNQQGDNISTCIAFKKDMPEHSPFTQKEKIIPAYSSALVLEAVSKSKSQFLLMRSKNIQQPLSSLYKKKSSTKILTSLWRFPTIDRHANVANNTKSPLEEYCKLFKKNFTLNLSQPKYFIRLTHFYTKYKITLQVLKQTTDFSFKLSTLNPAVEWKWVGLSELSRIGMSSADQKIRTALLSNNKIAKTDTAKTTRH